MKTSKQTYYFLHTERAHAQSRLASLFVLVLAASLAFTPVALAQMIKILTPINKSVSKLHSQVVTAKGWEGFDAQLWMNGTLAQSGKIRPDGIIDFINVTVPSGDVKLETRLVNPDGSTIESDTVSMHILGRPTYIKINLDEDHLRANSSSTILGKVQVLDEWSYPIQEDVIVTIDADAGKILTPDMDPQQRGTQIRLFRGYAEFEYQAPATQGSATITAEVEQAKSTVTVKIDMPLEPLSVVGLVDGSASAMKAGGDLTRVANSSSFPQGVTADGRAAVYARGTVGNDYYLTASYDSDRRNRARLFRDIDPDFLYSIYGDNSMLHYDVQTQSPLYVKIEKNQSYLLVGDFNTDLSAQEFTRYNRSLSGMKGEYRNNGWNMKGFGSMTDQQVVHKEIRGEGLSGFYNLGSTNITPGSEQVWIETRDKFHSEILINSDTKTRSRDYDIDYDQGTIFFKQPIPSFDQFGNPMWIVVTFEAISDKATSYVAGASVERTIIDNLTLNLTGVTEEQTPQNYNLFGASVKYQLGGNFGVTSEVARSSDFAKTANQKSSGNAYKVDITGTPLKDLTLHGYYRNMEDGFYNIRESGGRQERGSIRYGANGGYQFDTRTKLTTEYYETLQQTDLGQSKLTSFSSSLDHQFSSRLSALLSVQDLGYGAPDTSGGTISSHSTLGTASASYIAGERVKITAQHEQNLGSVTDVTRPNSTSLSASVKIIENTMLTAEDRFYQYGGNLAVLGLNSTVAEGTQVYSKYEIGNSMAGVRNMISVGIRNTVKLPYDLTLNMGYERAKDLSQRVDQTPTNDHVAYSAGLEFLPKEPVKASTKIEYGESSTSKKTNFDFAGDYRFQRDFSFIIKYNLGLENAVNNPGYQDLSHLILGLAYRPTESNAMNAIGKFEMKRNNNHYISPFDDNVALIGSIHTYIEPIHRFELGVKLAYKVATDNSDLFSVSTHTGFYLIRGTYDITEKFDVGAEYRALVQIEANDILYGYSIDVGYAVTTNLKLNVGYNFKGYKDRDLVDNNMWSAGPFVKFSYKFGEELFGK